MTYSVPSYLEETRSQTEDLIQQSQTSDFNLEILAQEWLSAVQVRQDRLTQELADLYAQFVGHVDQIRTIKDYQEEKSKLAMSELERHQTELSQLNVVKDEKVREIQQLEHQLVLTNAKIDEVGEKALEAVEVAKKFPHLHAQKNLFYHVSRIHWDKVSQNEHLVKGFAINPIKNDVSTFVLDQRELTDSRNHNILWDYIGAGVSSEWKRL
ncbi:uncharacterized protein LOC131893543 [Tigriopus californicus]|uniref:uncharacterized protein LOC131893543 n=1 Tax=Tigriopus californicus TaxID=6832 RepID=UPI0027DA38F1|nr:uncharacterized protein LOC131893543 [Tigriopus californicus]